MAVVRLQVTPWFPPYDACMGYESRLANLAGAAVLGIHDLVVAATTSEADRGAV